VWRRHNAKLKKAMISFHCATMSSSARQLKLFLEVQGFDVWVCNMSIEGGADFRDSIIMAAHSCDMFIALLNQPWVLSGECAFEYKIALNRSSLVIS
jgi:hypothetical protein